MTLDDRLEHYQDENIKNVNKLMTSKTPDWAGTYEEEKKNLKQAILSDLLEIIEENCIYEGSLEIRYELLIAVKEYCK